MGGAMAHHVKTTIRYDGPALARHEMDVQDLAPALIALAEIVQIANKRFNGDTAEIRVLVDADTEQKCFQLDLSLVQSLVDQAANFLGQKDVATAKDIAEWVGLTCSGAVGLFTLCRRMSAGGPSAAGVTFRAGTASGTTIVHINGDHNEITVPSQTAALANDPEVIKRVRSVVRPLAKPGYEDLKFVQGGRAVTEISKSEARDIENFSPTITVDGTSLSSSDIQGFVRIKAAQYEGTAKWSLLWNGRAISAEMPAAWVSDFQNNRVEAPPNTVLEVTMTETVRLDERGAAVGPANYVVTSVRAITPPPVQGTLV